MSLVIVGAAILLGGLLLFILGGPILSLTARLLVLAASAVVALVLHKVAFSGREACCRCTLEWEPRVCVGCSRDALSVSHIIYGPDTIAVCEDCAETSATQLALIKTQPKPEVESSKKTGACTFCGRVDVPKWELIEWPTATMCAVCARFYNGLLSSEKAAAS
jgi:hypothetical protein